jgi:peptide/nickel transport system ATP-binding protein
VPEQVLDIRNLSVDFVSHAETTHAVRDVSFSVGLSEILALVGESGSGKSVTASSVVRLLPNTARMSGSINLSGTDLESLSEAQMRKVRGAEIGMVFQDPMQALNPVFTVGWQVAEAVKLHQRHLDRAQLGKRAGELLRRAGIADAERRLDQYPHELSGGLRQRVMIAIAIANDPKLLIADEATTALDVTVQAEILDLFRDLRDESGMAVLVITHNMGVVADVADQVVVMRDGRVIEEAPVDQLFAHPEHAYTTELLASVPRFVPHPPGTRFGSAFASDSASPIRDSVETKGAGDLVLEVNDLVVEFGTRGSRFRAVDGVSLHIDQGEIVGLVGESGSGKSTVGRAAAGLYSASSGSVSVLGDDLSKLGRRRLHEVRRRCALVLQDPSSSLDPRMTVGQSIAEPI